MINYIEDVDLNGYECCFCKKEIQETRNDPVDINIVLHEDMIQKTEAAQSFYAHIACLYERLHQDVRGYCIKKREKIT
jgi:ribosome-associated translation inhibitor RaiA